MVVSLAHLFKGGLNFRFGKQFDDRSSVAGSSIEPIVNFSRTINSNFTPFNIGTLAPALNTNDNVTLQSQINDYLGRVGRYDQAFVATADGGAFAPAGSRWNFKAFYNEYDFYFQDTWKFRPNLTLDLGIRWEPKFSPSSEGLPILRPSQPAKLGEAPSNTLRWEEGELFKTDWNNFSPSVGFAWDPFKKGKTSIRANYRLAYDRFATQLFAASIYQSTPGNNFTFPTNNGFGQGGGLLRNLPAITPTSTPNALRQPGPLGTGSITVIDPDLVFPEIHQWFAGVQHELGFDTVLEVNYIGKRGTHLLGGYDANQVNINATDPRCGSQTFLQAFRLAQDATNPANCLATLLSGTSGAGGSPAVFRTQFLTQLQQGAAGTVAQTLAQRSGTTSLTANGFSPFLLMKYPQFTGAVNVIDSNDTSRYDGLEVIFKRRFNKGLAFQIGYTLSKSKDSRSFDPSLTTVSRGTVQSASSTPLDINNRRLNYTWSDFDRRHAVQATYVFELPFGKGKRFGSDMPSTLDFVIGGWQLAGNLNLASGRPFTLYSGVNTFGNVVSSTVNCNNCSRDMGDVVQVNGTNYYFTNEQLAQFSLPAAGDIGNTGRNFFIGPRQFQTDMSLSKKFRFSERYSFDLRVDARNLTNTPSFAAPNANFISTTAPFGRIRESVVSGSRKIQFSGKFNF